MVQTAVSIPVVMVRILDPKPGRLARGNLVPDSSGRWWSTRRRRSASPTSGGRSARREADLPSEPGRETVESDGRRRRCDRGHNGARREGRTFPVAFSVLGCPFYDDDPPRDCPARPDVAPVRRPAAPGRCGSGRDALPDPVRHAGAGPVRLHHHRLGVRQPPADDGQRRPRGGDLWIRYPDGTLQEPDRSRRLRGRERLPGRERASRCASRRVHWSGTKALFSMVDRRAAAAVPVQSPTTGRSTRSAGSAPARRRSSPRSPNQPADVQQRQPRSTAPTTASSSPPTGRATAPRTSIRSSTSTRRRRPSPASGASIPATGDLRLLDHAPSRRLHAHRRQLRPRDLHALGPPAARPAGRRGRDRAAARTAPSTAPTSGRLRRRSRPAPRSSPSRAPSAPTCWPARTWRATRFNQFFPWQMNQDGTELETLNHIGRHELHRYFNRSINDDPNLREFIDDDRRAASTRTRSRQPAPDQARPDHPGRYYGIDAPEFYTHAAGQVMSLPGAARASPATRSPSPTSRTASTVGYTGDGQPRRPTTRGHYREPAAAVRRHAAGRAHARDARRPQHGTRAAAGLALRLPPEAAARRRAGGFQVRRRRR